MNRRKIGNEKEGLACSYLKEQGFFILETNFWTRGGEIDIVAKEGGYLVFVEVKYRKSDRFGGSAYAISPKKIQSISRCALHYLKQRGVSPDSPIRFDAILIEGETISHIRNAFSFYSF